MYFLEFSSDPEPDLDLDQVNADPNHWLLDMKEEQFNIPIKSFLKCDKRVYNVIKKRQRKTVNVNKNRKPWHLKKKTMLK